MAELCDVSSCNVRPGHKRSVPSVLSVSCLLYYIEGSSLNLLLKSIGIVCFALISAACQVLPAAEHSEMNGRTAAKLVINGGLLLPLPTQYEELWPGESSFIVRQKPSSIGYRWIDKQEISFIGSDKTPYAFFSSAFNSPADDVEYRFIEGLDAERITYTVRDGLEFRHASLKGNEKLYVLAERLPFVVEITAEKDSIDYIEFLISSASFR